MVVYLNAGLHRFDGSMVFIAQSYSPEAYQKIFVIFVFKIKSVILTSVETEYQNSKSKRQEKSIDQMSYIFLNLIFLENFCHFILIKDPVGNIQLKVLNHLLKHLPWKVCFLLIILF